MARKIKGWVFDIGNVLIKWSTSNIIGKYQVKDVKKSQHLKSVTDIMNVRIDRGESFKAVMAEYIANYPEFENALVDWRDNWIEMFQPKICKTWVVMNELKKMGYPIYALSNFGKETFEFACRVYPELKTFDRHFISGYCGFIKPDQRIYEVVERETGLRSSEIFFIDDSEANCKAAKKRGWQVHLFKDGKRLKNHLNSLGVPLQNLNQLDSD